MNERSKNRFIVKKHKDIIIHGLNSGLTLPKIYDKLSLNGLLKMSFRTFTRYAAPIKKEAIRERCKDITPMNKATAPQRDENKRKVVYCCKGCGESVFGRLGLQINCGECELAFTVVG